MFPIYPPTTYMSIPLSFNTTIDTHLICAYIPSQISFYHQHILYTWLPIRDYIGWDFWCVDESHPR